MEKILKILKFLLIIQEKSNRGRNPKLGRGYDKAYRLNLYNPLSYISVVLMVMLTLIMFGVVGIWRELINPFKWN